MATEGQFHNEAVTTSGKVNRAKAERNRLIADAYRSGALMSELALVHGLSVSRISYIVAQQGARLTREEWSARHSEFCRAIGRDPVVRAKISASMERRWAAGLHRGRPRLFADDPVKRDDYLALRDACGAAYARQAMGLEQAA